MGAVGSPSPHDPLLLWNALAAVGKRERFDAFAHTHRDLLRHIYEWHLSLTGSEPVSEMRGMVEMLLHLAVMPQPVCFLCSMQIPQALIQMATWTEEIFLVSSSNQQVLDRVPAPRWMREFCLDFQVKAFLERIGAHA